jgi:tRNA G18 (ribose-2'-O)-methylase SpoU
MYTTRMQDVHTDTRNVVDAYRGLTVEEIRADMSARAFDFHVAIENFQHDINIGSVVRSANAFNAAAVHIIGKKRWNRRGAMSTEKYVVLIHHPDVESFLIWTKQHEVPIIGVDNVAGSVKLSQATLPQRCVLVMGQEGPGISPDMTSVCDMLVAIEQFGSTRSVNVGAAAAIVMYTWLQQHALKG